MVRQPAANCPNTARQQHNLRSWGPSHQSGTELLPTHGPSPSWRSCLLWLNVLFAGNWGWRHWEPFYLPYHEPAWDTESHGHTCSFLLDTKPLWHWMKWKSRPTCKRDPRSRYRPTGKCPPYRYEATSQLLHSEMGSNQVGYSCTWQRSLSREADIRATEEIPDLTRAEEVVITQHWFGHTKATKSHILSRWPLTVCHHCGQAMTIDHMLLECAVLQECRDGYYTVDSFNPLFETIPETCIVEFLWEAGFLYLIWCNLLTSISPETWTIWSDLSNLFSKWKQLWDTFTCVGQLICPGGRVSSLNKSNPTNQYTPEIKNNNKYICQMAILKPTLLKISRILLLYILIIILKFRVDIQIQT